MKLTYKSLLFLLIIIGLTSCGDDEPIGPHNGPETATQSFFKVDINEETFFADNAGMLTEDGITQIVGKRDDGNWVHIILNGGGVGNYILDGSANSNAVYHIYGQAPYTMDGVDTIGVVTITKYDVNAGLASGTFSFFLKTSDTTETTTPGDSLNVPTSIMEWTGNGSGYTALAAEDSTNTGDSTNVDINVPAGSLLFSHGEFVNIPLRTGMNPPNSNLGNFHVKLDGEVYDAESIQGELSTNNGLVINTSSDVKRFKLQVDNPTETTYDISSGAVSLSYTPDVNANPSIEYAATAGTLTITSIDQANNLVSGTFSGTLTDVDNPGNTITMTEGVFEDISVNPSDNGSVYFIDAKIDTTNFGSSTVSDTTLNGGLIGVRGEDQATGTSLQLNIPANVTTGNYAISETGAFSAVYTDAAGTDYITVNNSGNFAVSQRNGDIISGSFSFSVRNAAGEVFQVTQGQFNIDLGQ